MKTIQSIKPAWAILAMVGALVLASQSAMADTTTGAPAGATVTPPAVTGGDTDQINNNADTADIRTPQVVDPDIRELEVPDVETPDVEVPEVEAPDVEAPDVSIPEVETPDTN